MVKDPAFLFYSNDFETKTKFLTHEQVGKMIRIMITQHQHGHLSKEQIEFICGDWDDKLMKKFQVDNEGLYFNDRLENEINRRKLYSESRRKNVSVRYKTTHEQHMKVHMENENENIIYNINKGEFDKLWSKYPKKLGKKQAKRHFKASVKTEDDLNKIEIALKNYLNSERVLRGYVQNGSTWFNNWQDWVEFKEDVCPKCKGRGKYASKTGYEVICKCPAGNRVIAREKTRC